MYKLIFSIFISVIAVYLITTQFDLSGFDTIQERVNYLFFLPIILTNIYGVCLFSLRWYFLLDKKLSLKDCISSSFIGLAGNMVMPARGGDMVRIFIAKKTAEIPIASLVSKLFLEKVMDFTIVIFLGSGALLVLGLKGESQSSVYILFFSGLIVSGMILLLVLIRFFSTFLTNTGGKIFNLFGKQDFFDHHLGIHIHNLSQFLHWKTLKYPLMITIPTWVTGYSLTYFLQGYMFDIPLNYLEVLFLVFCGAVGVAIPSAPSGVGVLHASIISGFVLLGRPTSEGLVYATAVHLQQFLILTSIGFLFYIVWITKFKGKNQNSISS